MNSIKLSLASFASALAIAFVAAPAHADEAAPAPQEKPAAPAESSSFKSFAVEANPLGATIGHYSLQAEWLPAQHHAVVLNPHFDHTSTEVSVGIGNETAKYTEGFTGFGAELGYRYYTGKNGAEGFFVGPSILVASYTPSVGDKSGDSFTSIGAAVDFGGQWILGPGIVLGVGGGLQYTKVSNDGNTDGMSFTTSALVGGGVRPRALLSLGYTF
jgi:hypothetical protein